MTHTPRIFALIVAAGAGTRAGEGAPKQYRAIAGEPLLRYSLRALLAHPSIAEVQVVIADGHQAAYAAAVQGLALLPPVIGGAARSDSVQAGLQALASHAPDYVLIHDAARPFLPRRVLNDIIAKLSPNHAVVPALSVVDTMRRVDADHHWHEVPRAGLMRIQTPQAFPYGALCEVMGSGVRGLGSGKEEKRRKAGGSLLSHQPPAPSPQTLTDDAAIWLAAGRPLVYVEGDERLRKVTTAEDIAWAEKTASMRRVAVGMGFDVHQLFPAGEKHTMRIGGIDIAHDHKLHGHSDADVVLHAIVDALLGALAEGDIGMHFSPKDERWKGADSRVFVEETVKRVMARGGVIQHVDVTVICESPKIGPHREAMREAIAALLKLPLSHVSIKATTTEKLGFTGRGEGVAAQAVATLTLPEDA